MNGHRNKHSENFSKIWQAIALAFYVCFFFFYFILCERLLWTFLAAVIRAFTPPRVLSSVLFTMVYDKVAGLD